VTQTLEQELEQLIDSADYCVRLRSGYGLLVTLIYLPKLRVRGEGALAYVANGEIAEQRFHGRRKWAKAKRWVKREIEGHKELVRTVGQA